MDSFVSHFIQGVYGAFLLLFVFNEIMIRPLCFSPATIDLTPFSLSYDVMFLPSLNSYPEVSPIFFFFSFLSRVLCYYSL